MTMKTDPSSPRHSGGFGLRRRVFVTLALLCVAVIAATVWAHVLQYNMASHARPAIEGGAARSNIATFDELTEHHIHLINVCAVTACLALAMFALWFSRSVLARVRALTDAVARLASGEWQARLDCEGNDELDLLARQLNEMADTISKTHEELRSAETTAQTTSRAKSEFLASVSEEIRMPITVSLGYAEMLLGNLASPEDIETAATIKRNDQYVLEVIDDLRDLAKIESGRLRVKPVACSPREIVAEVTSLTTVRADAKGLTLSEEYEGPVPERIHTDPARLRQVLVNLVTNAVKSTELGTVRLVTQLLDDRPDRPRLQVQVIDSGVGMTQQQISRVFQPFARDDSETDQGFPAIGLGLTICKRLVDMLEGTIIVESTPGCGSTFTVTIPIGPLGAVRKATGPEEAVADAPQLGCRVLLAEDGRENRRLFSFILKKAGAEVVMAENGQEALDKVLADRQEAGSREPFDMILMDMQMPVMDGYDATRRLRQEGYTGRIVAITGHVRDYDRRKCLNAGCDDYLAKPIDRQQLLDIVTRHASQVAAGPPG